MPLGASPLWGYSDSGSTSALQANSRGSIPRDSTNIETYLGMFEGFPDLAVITVKLVPR